MLYYRLSIGLRAAPSSGTAASFFTGASMRLAQVIYSFEVGGSETVARNLTLGLSGLGHECAVWALEGDGPLNEELTRQRVQTSVIARKPGEYLRPFREVGGLIRRFRPALVHTHHLHELTYTAVLAWQKGIPLVHTEHETESLQSKKAQRRLRGLSRLCRFVTGVSDEVSEFLRSEVGIPRRKVRTIPNGVDLREFCPSVQTARPLAPQASVTLGCVARLDPLKDHETLLRAFSILRGSFPHATLLLVGEGALERDLRRLCVDLGIQERVQFLGTRRDVRALLGEMDVFVLSSRSEGLPMALLEAMAVGPVVVATRVGSIPEVIHHGETGFLVEAGDPTGLASALEGVMSRLHELQSVTSRARELIRERYSLEASLEEYLALYEQAVKGLRGR